jgi:dihydropyrimidinase
VEVLCHAAGSCRIVCPVKTLIKGGNVVTAVDSYVADILIDGSTIALIGRDLEAIAPSPDKTIDANGKLVIPGGIDPHTHLDLPFGGTSSSDDFETGTRAAAFGGTTTIVDFAVQYHGQALNQALDIWFAKAEGKATIDYGFHLIITDLPDQRLPELSGLINRRGKNGTEIPRLDQADPR